MLSGGGSPLAGAAEPADATDPALGTVRPGQPTPGAVGRVGPGADEGLAGPEGTGRRQRHELWMRRALEVAVTGPEPPAGDSAQVDDVPVGAVVYGPDGVELAVGRNERELTGTRPPTPRCWRCVGPPSGSAAGGWTTAPSW